MKILYKILIPTFLALCLCGCIRIYKIDIEQGKKIDCKTLEALKIGSSRSAVLQLLGTPALRTPFHPDRLDYIYYYKPGYGPLQRQHIHLVFEDDLLIKINQNKSK